MIQIRNLLFFLLHVQFISNVKYGYNFPFASSYLRANYRTLCDNINIKFDVWINTTRAALFYAKNTLTNATMFVYYNRPGIYLNVTHFDSKYGVVYLLDFFSNDWPGWHEIELKMTANSLVIGYDGFQSSILCKCLNMFRLNAIEENEIYFGQEITLPKFYIRSYIGIMKNIIYKGCGCDRWRNVLFSYTNNMDINLGECASISKACDLKKCACLINNSGRKRCQCSDAECVSFTNDIRYEFNFLSSSDLSNYDLSETSTNQLSVSSTNTKTKIQRLIMVDSSGRLNYDIGPEKQSLIIRPGQWLLLDPSLSTTCFKKVMVCEKGLMYSFWLRIESIDNRVQVLNHYSKENEHSIVRVRVEGDSVIGELLTDSKNDKLRMYRKSLQPIMVSSVGGAPLRIWVRYVLIYNMTDFCIYGGSSSTSNRNCTKVFNSEWDFIPMDRLFGGNKNVLIIGNSNNKNNDNSIMGSFKIDMFKFSTDINSKLFNESTDVKIKEFILEQHRNNKVKWIGGSADCDVSDINKRTQMRLILPKCIEVGDQNQQGFYIVMIISTKARGLLLDWAQGMIRLLKTNQSSIMLQLSTSSSSSINYTLDLSQFISWHRFTGDLLKNEFYLELSFDPAADNGYHFTLWIDLRCQLKVQKLPQYFMQIFQFNKMSKWKRNWHGRMSIFSNPEMVSYFRWLNVGRDMARRLSRILDVDFSQWTLDFDDTNKKNIKDFNLISGFIDRGGVLLWKKLAEPIRSFGDSCVRKISACYWGVTLTLWMNIEAKGLGTRNGEFEVFISAGISVSLNISSNTIQVVTLETTDKNRGNGDRESQYVRRKFVGLCVRESCFEKWCQLEVEVTRLGGVSVYVSGTEGIQVEEKIGDGTVAMSKCKWPHVCLGRGIRPPHIGQVRIDEVKLSDVSRQFLYANSYLSRGPSSHKLISFTKYQLNKSFRLTGSAKLIATKFGQGLTLTDFGFKSAHIDLSGLDPCFWNLRECRRGLLVRMMLRPDSLNIKKQRFLRMPHLEITSNLDYLVVRMFAAQDLTADSDVTGNDWMEFFISRKVTLQTFEYTLVEVSWRWDDGLKVIVNGELMGHVVTDHGKAMDSKPSHHGQKIATVGDTRETASQDIHDSIGSSVSGIVDDLELVAADRTNLAYETHHMDSVYCYVKEDFQTRGQVNLGIVGGGWCSNNSTQIELPACFSDLVTGCNDCWTIRFWMLLEKSASLGSSIVSVWKSGNVTDASNFDTVNSYTVAFHLLQTGFRIDVNSAGLIFDCFYKLGSGFLTRWRFIEISWDNDEGILLFVDRVFIDCNIKNKNVSSNFNKRGNNLDKYIEINDSFKGCIDEFEVYRNRLSILYWKKKIDENAVKKMLVKLSEHENQRQILMKLKSLMPTTNRNQGRSLGRSQNSIREEVVQELQFNGDGSYIRYKMNQSSPDILNSYQNIGGSRETIRVIFKVHNCVDSCVVWASESIRSLSTLSIKSQKITFSRRYTILSSNGTHRITEQIQVDKKILFGLIYKVTIVQQSGQVNIKIKTDNNSYTQKGFARNSLIDNKNGEVFLGGYRDNKEINSTFSGVIYQAKLSTSDIKPSIDIGKEMTQSNSADSIKKVGNVKILKNMVTIGSYEMVELVKSISKSPKCLNIQSPIAWWNLSMNTRLVSSVEFHISTLEANGLILLIEQNDLYFALELFDSKLFLIQKFSTSKVSRSKVIELSPEIPLQNYTVYIYRDYNSKYNLIVNKKLVSTNIDLGESGKSTLYHFGFLQRNTQWPEGILSRIGVIGCFGYLKIGDLGFFKFPNRSNIVHYSSMKNYLVKHPPIAVQDHCVIKTGNCFNSSLCGSGGSCKTRSAVVLPWKIAHSQLPDYICECNRSSKLADLTNVIDKFSPAAVWIWNYMLGNRGSPCSLDLPSYYLGKGGGYFKFMFTKEQQFPVPYLVDLQFTLKTRMKEGCVLQLYATGSSTSCCINNKKVILTLHLVNEYVSLSMAPADSTLENTHLFVPVNVSPDRWHLVSVKMRYSEVVLSVDAVSRVASIEKLIPNLFHLTELVIGHCTIVNTPSIGKTPSHPVKIGKLEFNSLPLLKVVNYTTAVADVAALSSLSNASVTAMAAAAAEAELKRLKLSRILTFTFHLVPLKVNFSDTGNDDWHLPSLSSYSATLLNNFVRAKSVKLFVSLQNEILLAYLPSNHSHIIPTKLIDIYIKDEISISVLATSTNILSFIFAVSERTISQIDTDIFCNSSYSVVISLDLIWFTQVRIFHKEGNKLYKIPIGQISQPLEYGDPYYVFLGGKSQVANTVQYPLFGCFVLLSSDGQQVINLLEESEGFTYISPPNSIGFGVCKNVESCNIPSICNGGICTQDSSGYRVHCNCDTEEARDRMGRYCNILKMQPCNNVVGLCYLPGGQCRMNYMGSRYCHCRQGYFGAHCANDTAKFEVNAACRIELNKPNSYCINGGECTLYSVPGRLCEPIESCGILEAQLYCLCDSTFYRGVHCSERELGFSTAKSKAIIMTQSPKSSSTQYIRILFTSKSSSSNYSQTLLEFSQVASYKIRLIMNDTLFLNTIVMGPVKSINALNMLITDKGIAYLLNNQSSFIPVDDVNSRNRVRRSADDVNKLIAGCDESMNNCFDGVLGGLKWNGKKMMDPKNKLIDQGKEANLSALELIFFPVEPSDSSLSWNWLLYLGLCLFLCVCFIIAGILYLNFRKTKKNKKLTKKKQYSNCNYYSLDDQMSSSNHMQITPMTDSDTVAIFENLITKEQATPQFVQVANINPYRHIIIISEEDLINLKGCMILDVLALPRTNSYCMLLESLPIKSKVIQTLYSKVSGKCSKIYLTKSMQYVCADITDPFHLSKKTFFMKIWGFYKTQSKWKEVLLRSNKVEQRFRYYNLSVPVPGLESDSILVYSVAEHQFLLYQIISSSSSSSNNNIIQQYYYDIIPVYLTATTTLPYVISAHPSSPCNTDAGSQIPATVMLRVSNSEISSPTHSPSLCSSEEGFDHDKRNDTSDQYLLLLDVKGRVCPVDLPGKTTCIQILYVRDFTYYLLLDNNTLLSTNENGKLTEVKKGVLKICVGEFDTVTRVGMVFEDLSISIINIEASSIQLLELKPNAKRENLNRKDVEIVFSWNCRYIFRVTEGLQLNLWNVRQDSSNICRFYRVQGRPKNGSTVAPVLIALSPSTKSIAVAVSESLVNCDSGAAFGINAPSASSAVKIIPLSVAHYKNDVL